MIKPIHLIATVGLLFSAFGAYASDPINYDTSKWTIHSAFNDQPRKVIDTPNTVYFFVHSTLYSSKANVYDTNFNTGYYNTPSGAIFYLDKNNPEAGIQDLAKFTNLAGYDIRMVNYDTVKGNLVIAYSDGGIDIVKPDGTSVYIQDLKKKIIPGSAVIANINFDISNGDIWIATGSGYIHIDAETCEVKHAPDWNEAVTEVVPMGDNIMVVIANKLYFAPKTSNLNLRSNFVNQTFSGNSSTISRVMPLTDNIFVSLNANGSVYWFTPKNATSWQAKVLGSSNTVTAAAATNLVIDKYDHTISPTTTGFYVSAKNKGHFIKRPETEGGVPTLESVTLDNMVSIYNASYDGKTFWYYDVESIFKSENLDGEQTAYKVNAPITTKDNTILYSPTQGLILVNKHPHIATAYYTNYQTAYYSSYKNGKWTDLSSARNMPKLAQENEAAASAFTTKKTKFTWPVSLPMGALVDPLNPDVLFLTSPYNPAIAAVYLDDPTKTPHMIVRTADASYDSFNAVKELETQSWGDFGPSIPLGTDNNGNIWFYYNNAFSDDVSYELMFYYVTPEGRNEALNIADPFQKQIEYHSIHAPYSMVARKNFWLYGTVMRHPSVQNKIASATFEGDPVGSSIRVFDHNGTLEDTSDDTVTAIRFIRLPSGDLQVPTSVRNMAENPLTGDLAIAAFHDTWIINLNDPVVDGIIDGRPVGFTSENNQSTSFRASCRGNVVSYDEYGRLWVGTVDNGVIGLSNDGKTVIAHYDMSNSPIGDNDIRGLGWNPDTQSLFISTRGSIAEVKVDATGHESSTASSKDAHQQTMAYPTLVTPEFAGNVAFYYVPAGVTLRIRNSKGQTVRELEAVDGITHWDLMDADGNQVPSDKYTILDSTGSDAFSPITVTVVR